MIYFVPSYFVALIAEELVEFKKVIKLENTYAAEKNGPRAVIGAIAVVAYEIGLTCLPE